SAVKSTSESLGRRATGLRVRRLLLVTLMVCVVAGTFVWRAYRHFVPSGTNFYPIGGFLDPIVEGPILVSPHGGRMIQVMFNDAGGAHSGNHWTWLIVDHRLTGKHVVAEGYSLPDVRYRSRAFPMRWVDDRTIAVEFAAGRHGTTSENPVVVRLP